VARPEVAAMNVEVVTERLDRCWFLVQDRTWERIGEQICISGIKVGARQATQVVKYPSPIAYSFCVVMPHHVLPASYRSLLYLYWRRCYFCLGQYDANTSLTTSSRELAVAYFPTTDAFFFSSSSFPLEEPGMSRPIHYVIMPHYTSIPSAHSS